MRGLLRVSFSLSLLIILTISCKNNRGGSNPTGPSKGSEHSLTISEVSPAEAAPGTEITIRGDHFMEDVTLLKTNAKELASGKATAKPDKVGHHKGATATTKDFRKKNISNKVKKVRVSPGNTTTNTDSSEVGDQITIFFGAERAPLISVTDTLLVTEVPANATTNIINLTVADQSVTWDGFRLIPPLEITSITPTEGPIGTPVTLNGAGFASAVDSNSVTFNGTTATITHTDSTSLEVTVPSKATSGPINVQAYGQTATGPTFTVTEVNKLTFTSSNSFTLEENTSAAGTVIATDPDNNPITYSISGGPDKGQFTIDEQYGELDFTAAPDHESPADSDTDNIYEVQVQASNGSKTTSQDITIEVQNLNDSEPVIITETISHKENITEVGIIEANDPDGDDLSYSVHSSPGSTTMDGNKFTIDTQTGLLSFKNPPDYEAEASKDDSGIAGQRDNNYRVQINITDGMFTARKVIEVPLQDVAEPPVFLRGNINNGEYQIELTDGTFISEPLGDGTDTGNEAITILLEFGERPTSATIGGPDASLFNVDNVGAVTGGTTYGSISISGPVLDYGHSADGTPHQYKFTVTATSESGATGDPQTFVIPVQPFVGSGTQADPYQVETLEQLQAVGQYLDAHFEQTQDIDASPTSSWNGGEGFSPIGSFDDRFKGSYNGQGFEISNLTINRPNSTAQGLFGTTATGSNLKNITITGADFTVHGASGVLAGYNRGIIDNCSATGTIGYPNDIGYFELIFIGGLVGYHGKTPTVDSKPMSGKIINTHSGVTVTGGHTVGGLVGYNSAPIDNSSASGSIAGGISGGLTGSNSAKITNSHASGFTRGASSSGGLVGQAFPSSSIENSWATGNIADTGSKGCNGGGLVGTLAGTIVDSWASGTVDITEGAAGGLVGSSTDSSTTIKRSFATGSASSATCSNGIGGFIGYVGPNTTIHNSYATGNATYEGWTGMPCETTSYAAAFAGTNLGTIYNSYAIGVVKGFDSRFALGGLIGTLQGYHGDVGSTTSSYWDTETTNQSNSASGTGLTTSQMTGSSAQNYMTGFNFSTIWQTNAGGYPTLRNNPPPN